MKALLFPGQGSQFSGMGKLLFQDHPAARALFLTANDVLGFDIAEVMFEGSEDDLRRTSVTQPAIFIHSVAAATAFGLASAAHMAAGHSLGEFSALTVAGALRFEDGLHLVAIRANAMQKACDAQDSIMAAILGMDDAVVEAICRAVEDDLVVPANYNTTGQIVISGTRTGVAKALEIARNQGARRAVELAVNGAFHSPLMEPARLELAEGIQATEFTDARIPVYQNTDAQPHTAAEEIKINLLAQLTQPVRWTQTVQNMLAAGATEFIECGPGNVLQGMVKKADRTVAVSALS